MGRINKSIAGAFKNLFKSDGPASYKDFIKYGEGLEASNKLKMYTNMYKSLVKKNEMDMRMLAALEELVIQMRIRENISDIRVDIVRNYIYARCSFLRNNSDVKDIRVLVGTTETYGKAIKKIYSNDSFINVAKEKLGVAMDAEIEESINRFNNNFKKVS